MCSLNFSRKTSHCSKLSGANCHSYQPCRVLAALGQHSLLLVLHWSRSGGGVVELRGGFIFCICLITNSVKHLFTCWLAIWVSSFLKYLFKSLAYFPIGLFLYGLSVVDFLFICKSSLYILATNPVSFICTANVFSHCVRVLQKD